MRLSRHHAKVSLCDCMNSFCNLDGIAWFNEEITNFNVPSTNNHTISIYVVVPIGRLIAGLEPVSHLFCSLFTNERNSRSFRGGYRKGKDQDVSSTQSLACAEARCCGCYRAGSRETKDRHYLYNAHIVWMGRRRIDNAFAFLVINREYQRGDKDNLI